MLEDFQGDSWGSIPPPSSWPLPWAESLTLAPNTSPCILSELQISNYLLLWILFEFHTYCTWNFWDTTTAWSCHLFFFFPVFLFIYLFILILFNFKLYIIVLVLPNIKMNPPQVYMCSPSWTLLPPPSPYHPSGSSQCTSPKCPVSSSLIEIILLAVIAVTKQRAGPPGNKVKPSHRNLKQNQQSDRSIEGYWVAESWGEEKFPTFHLYYLI